MRDHRFVTLHRGGPLTPDHHRLLIRWARECSEHLLARIGGRGDARLADALCTAREWEERTVPTGAAMKAARAAHAAAREAVDPVLVAAARSVGHAVATAHMADHSMGAALYALKALKNSGPAVVEEERVWQLERLEVLPKELADLVVEAMGEKMKYFVR